MSGTTEVKNNCPHHGQRKNLPSRGGINTARNGRGMRVWNERQGTEKLYSLLAPGSGGPIPNPPLGREKE